MILEKSFIIGLLTTAARRPVTLIVLMLLSCSAGCASSGPLQPHQAFRQLTTPYQGYYQGQQAAYGAESGSGSRAPGEIAGYRGYNNSLPGSGQSNAVGGSSGVFGNQLASPFVNPNGASVPIPGNYQQYYPNAGYNYQPAFTGGFTSGSC